MSKDAGKDNAPTHPHLTAEFFVWLWYAADRDGGNFNLDGLGVVDMWVEDRLSFRVPDEDKARAVLTGDDTASSAEARAALASGKIVRDLQLHLRHEEREYSVTLRGVHLDLAGLKFPAHSAEGEDGLLYERMFLYENAYAIVTGLYRMFARERTDLSWHSHTLPQIRAWVQQGEAAIPDAPDIDGIERSEAPAPRGPRPLTQRRPAAEAPSGPSAETNVTDANLDDTNAEGPDGAPDDAAAWAPTEADDAGEGEAEGEDELDELDELHDEDEDESAP